MRRLLVLIVLGTVMLGGCAVSQDQIDMLQASAADLRTELAILKDAGRPEDAEMIGTLEDRIAAFEAEIAGIEVGEFAWLDLTAAMIIAALGFSGGGTVAIPFVRSAKNIAKTIMKSVDAGGGVKNPEAATAVLTADKKAFAAFMDHKAAIATS